MKRTAFIRELVQAGCYLKRHGQRHDIYAHAALGTQAPVPRHSEVADELCKLIRKQLRLTKTEDGR